MTVQEIQKIIAEKVTGVWEAQHTVISHKYHNLHTGHTVDSVTTKIGEVIAKPHLIKWASKKAIEWLMVDDRWKRLFVEQWKDEMMTGAMLAHTDIRDDAGNIGGVAHSMADRFVNEWLSLGVMPIDIKTFAPPNCDPRSIAAARAIESWFKKNEVKPIASEIIVGDFRFSAGQIDLICLMKIKGKERLVLTDYKSSNGISETYRYQVAAYKVFLEFMCPELKIYQSKILHCSKDSDKFTVYNLKNMPQAWKSFKSICSIYDDSMSKYDKIVKDIKKLVI